MNEMRPLSVVTGASSGIGYELAKLCAQDGMNLIIAADRPDLAEAAQALREHGVEVETVQVDLSTVEGVDRLLETIGDRPVELLMANAGEGLGHAFLDQAWGDARHVIDTNVTGDPVAWTLNLIRSRLAVMLARADVADAGKFIDAARIEQILPQVTEAAYRARYHSSKSETEAIAMKRDKHTWQTTGDRSWERHSAV